MASTQLEIQNPWWHDKNEIHKDFHLTNVLEKSYYYPQPLLKKLTLAPGDFHIFRGPRQVGKTTLVKEWIRQLLLEKKVPAQSILYLSCEGLEHFSELQDILIGWFKNQKRDCFLFLDEISFVPEWQRAVLLLFNAGLLRQSCLCVTGSNARDLKESGERFPGRRGKGKDCSLYPLTWKDYQDLACFQNLTEEKLVEIYFRIGGFPHAIRDYVEYGGVTDETVTTYRNWILTDAARFELSEEILKQILYRVAQTLGSRITWPSLIETTTVKSHETALAYVEHLQDAFLCHTLHCYDPKINGPAFSKARKIYFIDPLLYFLARGWKENVVNIAPWIEEQVSDPRIYGSLLESFFINLAKQSFPSVYFWYSTKIKKEVDLVLPQKEALEIFEIKKGSEQPYRVLGKNVTILGAKDLFKTTWHPVGV